MFIMQQQLLYNQFQENGMFRILLWQWQPQSVVSLGNGQITTDGSKYSIENVILGT